MKTVHFNIVLTVSDAEWADLNNPNQNIDAMSYIAACAEGSVEYTGLLSFFTLVNVRNAYTQLVSLNEGCLGQVLSPQQGDIK